jgi:hypothetical protein
MALVSFINSITPEVQETMQVILEAREQLCSMTARQHSGQDTGTSYRGSGAYRRPGEVVRLTGEQYAETVCWFTREGA